MELHKVMGDLIVQHRFSKRQICETLGITRVTLNSYLSGSVSPSVDLLVKFLNLFDIQLDTLLNKLINHNLLPETIMNGNSDFKTMVSILEKTLEYERLQHAKHEESLQRQIELLERLIGQNGGEKKAG